MSLAEYLLCTFGGGEGGGAMVRLAGSIVFTRLLGWVGWFAVCVACFIQTLATSGREGGVFCFLCKGLIDTYILSASF